jgi:uncharacterized protein YbaR (Trm112 family)
MTPVCPYCKEELLEDGETEESSSYFCCVCKIYLRIYDMTDTEPCEGD